MGLGGISIWQLLIILAIVLLLFGTKRLSSLGTDLGGAIKGFRKSLNGEEESADGKPLPSTDAADTAEKKTSHEPEKKPQ
jgi:sec-independent protein translocase protein TatA